MAIVGRVPQWTSDGSAQESFFKGHQLRGSWPPLGWPIIAAMVSLVGIKQMLVSTLPIMVYSTQKYDDLWMVSHAASIRANNWLGVYDQWTLVKGAFGPFFLAVCSKLGISFLTAEQLLHSFACLVVVIGFLPIIRSSVSRIVLFAALLFDPISWAAWTFQRVYRSGLTVSQVLIVIGCIAALYLRRSRPILALVPWAFGAGVGLVTMWHNREDTAWILPFVLVASAILMLDTIWEMFRTWRSQEVEVRSATKGAARCVGALLVSALPLAMLGGSNLLISRENLQVYGLGCYNEINDCHFPDFMNAVYSVKWDTSNLPDRIDVPLEKWQYLYTLSPTLDSISDSMDWAIDAWSRGTGDVQNGMLIWPIRDAVRHAGYYQASGPKGAAATDRLYQTIAEEINAAIDSGLSESQATMPSSLMPPWRSSYSETLPSAVKRLGSFVISFEGVEPSSKGWDDQEVENRLFAGLTGDRSIQLADNAAPVEIQYLNPIIDRLNFIKNVYSAVFPTLAGFAVLIWTGLFASLFKKDDRTRERGAYLLLSAGVAGSFAALLVGVSYNDVASVKSSYYMYLSGAYPLLVLFAVGTICFGLEALSPVVARRFETIRSRFPAKASDEGGSGDRSTV